MKNRKSFLLLLTLLAAGMLLNGCAGFSSKNAVVTALPGTESVQPGTDVPGNAVSKDTVTLFFRYGSEPFLAGESRTLAFSPAAGREKLILSELMTGPDHQPSGLTGLFPAGTKVTGATLNGRTLFVILSREILNSMPDEPEEWRKDPFWSREVPRRRQLAMQSIVATVTENCDVDRVQIMLEANGEGQGSLRLPMSYFMEDENSTELSLPLEREESLILSPSRVMSVICDLCMERDWERLYRYVAMKDETAGTERPEYRNFVTTMENRPRIGSVTIQGGYTDITGRRTVFTVSAAVLEANGALRDTETSVVKLVREKDLWKITMNQLTSWPEG